MTLPTNDGNAFLDSWAAQINALEKDPNATPQYDQQLEAEFALVKAQILGSNPSSGSSQPSCSDSGGKGAPSGGSGTPAGGSGNPSGTTPPEADSISKVS